MSKSPLHIQALELRRSGISVKEIAKRLGIAKSTTSLWVRNVILSVEQLEQLRQKSIKGAELGRTRGSLMQKNRRLEMIESNRKSALNLFGSISDRELDLIGTCLYWSEGSKKTRKVELCNSDPNIINIFIKWLERTYELSKEDFHCYVGINDAHRHREVEVKEYWSKNTNIPLSHFTKTSFKKYPLRKKFENFNEHFGTLSVRVLRPTRIFYNILGKIHAISILAM